MNKSMITGIVVGAVVATAGGAIAMFGGDSTPVPAYAEVLDVREVKETVTTPREECQQVPVTQQKPVRDEHRVAGTVAGALVGGALGNQVGGGSGKKIATVAGAAAGGYAGNKTQEHIQTNNTQTTYETHCRTVHDSHEEFRGYDVTYSIGDETGSIRLDYHPGSRIPLEDGKLLTSQQN